MVSVQPEEGAAQQEAPDLVAAVIKDESIPVRMDSLLRVLAEGISKAFKRSIKAGLPLIIVFDTDFGSLLGNILHRELHVHTEIVSIDLVHLNNFDFIDIGKKLPDVQAVPIVVKSLVFKTERERIFLQ